MKFKAAILENINQPLLIDEIENDMLTEGQVLIKILQTGVCRSQVFEMEGQRGLDKYLPHLLGHEGCATVITVGPVVKTVSEGDLVVLHWRRGAGIQSETPKYIWKGTKVNAGWVTTFNKYAIISENRCTSIPSDTDKELAALFGCAITTGFGVINNDSNLKLGQSVIILGLILGISPCKFIINLGLRSKCFSKTSNIRSVPVW